MLAAILAVKDALLLYADGMVMQSLLQLQRHGKSDFMYVIARVVRTQQLTDTTYYAHVINVDL